MRASAPPLHLSYANQQAAEELFDTAEEALARRRPPTEAVQILITALSQLAAAIRQAQARAVDRRMPGVADLPVRQQRGVREPRLDTEHWEIQSIVCREANAAESLDAWIRATSDTRIASALLIVRDREIAHALDFLTLLRSLGYAGPIGQVDDDHPTTLAAFGDPTVTDAEKFQRLSLDRFDVLISYVTSAMQEHRIRTLAARTAVAAFLETERDSAVILKQAEAAHRAEVTGAVRA
jgi:hypothetical protein